MVEDIAKQNFDVSDEKPTDKLIYTIYGDKGSGKTTSSLALGGKIFAISFDHKTVPIKENMFPDKPIKVKDGVRYFNKRPDKILETAYMTYYGYLQQLLVPFLKVTENAPDWILIDGLEKLSNVCEMTMRYERGYKPYQGISNLNDWKYRNDMMHELHQLCVKIAKKGVIYTTYTKIEEVIVDGVVVQRKEIPKWFGTVLEETDITLRTIVGMDNESNTVFKVKVENSKKDSIMETGKIYLVTKDGFKLE